MKKYLILLPLVTLLIFPLISLKTSAATVEDLLAQIRALTEQLNQLRVKLAELQNQPATGWCYDFGVDLKIGDKGEAVTALAKVLTTEGLLKSDYANSVVFDENIAAAVSGFQQKYKDEILTPLGLKYPTGFVGKATRAKLNALYGCKITKVTPTPPPLIESTWKVYRNETFGFEIQYPANWAAAEYPEHNVFLLDPKAVTPRQYYGQVDAPGGLIEISFRSFSLREGGRNAVGYYNSLSSPEIFIGVNNSVRAKVSEITTKDNEPNPWYNNRHLITYTILKAEQDAIITIGYASDLNDEYLSTFKQIVETVKLTTSTPLSLTLISPNGGEIWEIGKTYTIKWYSNLDSSKTVQIGLIDIRYSSEAGLRGEATIANSVPNTGIYNWTIPEFLGTMNLKDTDKPFYKIKIYIEEGGIGKFDESNLPFSIVASSPRITLISPNGEESWEAGKTYTIKWNSSNFPANDTSRINISIRKEGETFGQPILWNLPNSGSADWTIPSNFTPGKYRIIVTSIYNADESDSPFYIGAPSPSINDTDFILGSISKATFHPYGFSYGVRVMGSKSINDLKKEIPKLIGLPVAYYVFDSSGKTYRGDAGCTGGCEMIKNGQNMDISFVIQEWHQAIFDQTKKIMVIVDPDNLISETREDNNVMVFVLP